jgi:RND superfamily putative drug exporter
MFAAIARFDVRFRWVIVVVWLVAVPLATKALPSLASVTKASNAQFLPASAPSSRAAALASPLEGKNPSSSGVLVAARSGAPLTAADKAAFARVVGATRRVRGVIVVRDLALSANGKAQEATVVAASGSLVGAAATDVVDGIRATFAKAGAPPGLRLYLTGPIAADVDAAKASPAGSVAAFSLLFILVLLFLVYRSALAPLVTLVPAGLSLAIAEPLIAEAARHGLFSVSQLTELLLIVLLLGAGTDYGLFLVFRAREEFGRGHVPREAVVRALSPVGQAISYSALTVAAALLTLLLAVFGIYHGLGPALAIGLGVLLLASLTLTPALLAIFGRAAFWPSRPRTDDEPGAWGRVAQRVVRKPMLPLLGGVVLFGALAAGLIGYQPGGFIPAPPAGSDSARGTAALAADFPKLSSSPEELLLRFSAPVWHDLGRVDRAETLLAASPAFRAVSGPFDLNGVRVSPAQLGRLHALLGSPAALGPAPPAGVPAAEYALYRATAEFITPGGRTVLFLATFRAGPPGSLAATDAVPRARTALASVARAVGAPAHGVAGQDASSYDINHYSNSSLLTVVPVVLALILVLLALLLRSLVAPWYLVVTVGLSYLAALGFAMIAFVHLGGDGGIVFLLPLLLFIFSMALGEDYNILLMSRIREEAKQEPSLRQALVKAIGITGTTITSAGIILAGTFVVLGTVGFRTTEVREVGYSVAFGILLDTFFVRTLLVPSVASLLGRWNWWPSRLSRRGSP